MVSIEKLMELGVLRESVFDTSGGWYVIYTQSGPIDITLSQLTEQFDVGGLDYNSNTNKGQ